MQNRKKPNNFSPRRASAAAVGSPIPAITFVTRRPALSRPLQSVAPSHFGGFPTRLAIADIERLPADDNQALPPLVGSPFPSGRPKDRVAKVGRQLWPDRGICCEATRQIGRDCGGRTNGILVSLQPAGECLLQAQVGRTNLGQPAVWQWLSGASGGHSPPYLLLTCHTRQILLLVNDCAKSYSNERPHVRLPRMFRSQQQRTMLRDIDIRKTSFRKAVISIERRAERQSFDEQLVRTFVPNRILDELDTTANQLLFGRRGVGKTHTLKALLGRLTAERGDLATYIDCTSFGSGIGSEGTAQNVGTRFFSGLLKQLAYNVLDFGATTENPRPGVEDIVLGCAARLETLAVPDREKGTFDYQSIVAVVNQFLDRLQAERIYLLIDEWANIPKPSQPYFAECLKRSMFSNKRVTVKIGVVDYTYILSQNVGDNLIGLEKSADIFSDIRMDRYFVWDQHEAFVERFFAEVVFNHLAVEVELPFDTPSEVKAEYIINQLFTQRKVFSEMCRASEGNTRDLLVLLGKAHNRFIQQVGHQKIGLEDVYAAASDLYRADKLSNLTTEKSLEEFLDYLVNDIIRERRSRTFMVPYASRSHPLLTRLFSARLLHPLEIEWSHPDRPGERYSLITMDYGTYAAFKGTKNEPLQGVLFDRSLPQPDVTDLVPLDDRRSIRRIVVGEDVLEKFYRIWQSEVLPAG
jgi:hypothetical protein